MCLALENSQYLCFVCGCDHLSSMAEHCRGAVLLLLITGFIIIAALRTYHLFWFIPTEKVVVSRAGLSPPYAQPDVPQASRKYVHGEDVRSFGRLQDTGERKPKTKKLGRIQLGKHHNVSTGLGHRLSTLVSTRRRVHSEGDEAGTKHESSVRMHLMHRDAIGSPMRSEVATYYGRLKGAIDRSATREQAIIHGAFQDSRAATRPATRSRNTSVVIPVTSGIGEYLMPFALGTPKQSFTTILDTGSDLVWLQCKPCLHCLRQQVPYYDPVMSSSFQRLSCFSPLCRALPKKRCGFGSCLYTYEYGDQSFTAGDYASETLTLSSVSGGSLQVWSFGFGCGHNNHGSFSGAGGLVGLGQGPLSFASQISSVVSNKFCYCLVGIDESESVSSPMVFGDAAEPKEAGVRYTPIVTNMYHPTYYYVGLTGISVGGQRLDVIPNSTFDIDAEGNGGMVFDSGTTLTMLPRPAYEPVVETFEAEMRDLTKVDGFQSGLDLCYDVSGLDSVDVPTLTFHFVDADFDVPASNTFILVDQEGTLCLALQMSSVLSIFGNIQQQNFQVVYDRENSRLGFVPKQCRDV